MSETSQTAHFLTLITDHGELMVLMLGLITLLVLALQIRSQRKLIDAESRHLEDLRNEVSSYGQSLIAMRTLLTSMESRINEFTERNLEIQSQYAFNRSFEEASRLVKDGGSAQSLVTDCGLSDAEAALMIRLHGTEGQKPRQQWKQVPISNAVTADDGMAAEEIRLRETMRAARTQSR